MSLLAALGVTFAHPMWLLALLGLPVLALIEWRAVTRARRAARLLTGPRAPNALLAQQLPRERVLGMALRLAALTLLLFGAAGPQWGHETVRRQSKGSDLVFAIDVSRSMDARDVAPSRLDEARREAMALLDRVEGSRVGVLVFAGDADRLCPLTLDHDATRLTLMTLSTSSVSMPGTDLGRALTSAAQMLPAGRRDEQAIVLWTDGEDLEGHGSQALAKLRESGTRVFAVGVGTPAGEVIPEVDEAGRVVDVHRDGNGNVVRSQLGERFLRELASATRGAYFSASRPGGELGRLALAMGSLARSQRGARLMERPVARFTWFALLAAVLLAAEQIRWRRSPAGVRARRAGSSRGAGLAAALLALLLAPRGAGAQTDWARGDAAFRAGQWARAESLYARRAGHGAPAPVLVNLATARARQGRANAERDLSRLTAQTGTPGQAAGYNLGTLYAEQHDADHALQELRRALERDPRDEDARWNYELMMQAKQQRQQPKEQPKKPEKQKPNPSQPDRQGRSGNQGQPPPQPSPQQPQGAPPSVTPQSGMPGGAPGMTREQAEKLLGSLEELERLEKQNARQVKVMREHKGKDW
jgi:Ca-activated chloride channel family protein